MIPFLYFKRSVLFIGFFTLILAFPSCENKIVSESENASNVTITDPLPSWKDGETRQSIIDFVKAISDTNGRDFIPIEERIACFDNDGTLWSEKPFYFQLFFAIDRVKEMAVDHPEWKDLQPYKSILEDDIETFSTFGEHGIIEIVMASHTGMSPDEFELIVKNWLKNSRHPRFDRPFSDLVYQPMLELLAYLSENEFKCFIVSGGGIEFMRPWVEEVYGIPKNQVVGSSIKTELIYKDSIPEIIRLAQLDFINDKDEKPLGINKFIGRRPVFTVGNSDGDLAMLKWTSAGEGKRMMIYVHHTDSIREWAYDRTSSIGRLNNGLDEARRKNWTIINMKEDWKLVYPFEIKDVIKTK